VLLGDRLQLPVVVPDALRQRADLLKDGPERRHERLGDVLGRLVVEASGRALGQAGPEGLDRSADVIDQLRAGAHQRLPGADDGQVSLGAFASVLERIQQPGIQSCQASQVLKASISSVLRLFE
jgi:hypothetical protein